MVYAWVVHVGKQLVTVTRYCCKVVVPYYSNYLLGPTAFTYMYFSFGAKFGFSWNVHPNSPERGSNYIGANYILYLVSLVHITPYTTQCNKHQRYFC